MADFLTVEDVNSVFLNYKDVPFWDKVTVSLPGTDEFSDFTFDYCTVTRTYSGGDYTFTITVENSLWNKKYYVLDGDGEPISTVTVSDGDLVVVTDSEVIDCYFYLWGDDLEENSTPINVPYVISNVSPLKSFYGRVNPFVFGFDVTLLDDTYPIEEIEFTVTIGSQSISVDGAEHIEVSTILNNTNSEVLVTVTDDSFNQTWKYKLYVTKGNVWFASIGDTGVLGSKTVYRFASTQLTGNFDETDFKLSCKYPVEITSIDSYINIEVDLRGKVDTSPFTLTLEFLGNDLFLAETTKVRLDCDYLYVRTGDELLSALNGSVGIIRLGADVELTENVVLDHDCSLVGNGFSCDLSSGYTIDVQGDVDFKVSDVNFVDVSKFVIQETGSTVELVNCGFTGDSESSYKGIGKIVRCNSGVDSFNVSDDFKTTVSDCQFVDIGNCFLHGGQLNITGCSFNLSSVNSLDFSYPYFLYQTDGSATLSRNSFDVAYSTDSEVVYGDCLFVVGRNAFVNGRGWNDWRNNRSTVLIDDGNHSSVDIQYHHSGLDSDVRLLGENGYCYAVSGVDFVFRVNVEASEVE